MNNMTRILLAAALCATMAACAKKVKEEAPPPPPPPAPAPAPAPVDDGKYDPSDLDTDSCLRQRVVYFDFDQSDVKAEFAAIMSCHAKYLRDRPSARITLEGHADERGTREYNLGLGERRGNAVSDALQGNGGSASQLSVVSYGEERPTCNDSSDSCWGQNRRVEIVYTAK
ncbi:peptidoglycan-associated lipoprotein Pal [Pseudomarimonas salicorniae]|uniref:Peptidoglycan-associated lipoprotein n=1 Tax=Pseudomarimonas salicorniae TaxID=2933270 RepID=A0ABT0GDL8_9GAMM|nr:peptidoglycan-associated lipoprotein Pal [Lysobacter sp. CAU 1642]MCK7592640.1 peptidoglycan-associated lipoprotein Pal [Lysobacter sp. CAU 1642]